MVAPSLVITAVLSLSCSVGQEYPQHSPGSRAVESICRGNTAFAVALYQKVGATPGNVFFSPLSLSTALAMTYAGARGDTALQMARVLHFPQDQTGLHEAFAALTRDFNAPSPDYELSVANALWGQKDFLFIDPFLATLKTHYGAGLNLVDFVMATENARTTINGWVETRTRDKIKDLLAPGILTPETRLVLTNAVYFKGLWASQFDKQHTRDEPFYLNADKSEPTPLMNIRHTFGYLEEDQFQALEMPYKGKTLSMVILLPKAVDGLATLEHSLTPEKLLDWITAIREQEVIVTLPRFKMTSQFRLEEVLSDMGMPLAFSARADFSGMTGRPDLFISAVVHKAFVDVNEEGTEAAAATAVVMSKTSVAAPSRPPVFRADHPFLFLIRDRRSNSVLFMGRVANPNR